MSFITVLTLVIIVIFVDTMAFIAVIILTAIKTLILIVKFYYIDCIMLVALYR